MSAPPRAHDAERTRGPCSPSGPAGSRPGQQRGLDLAQRPPCGCLHHSSALHLVAHRGVWPVHVALAHRVGHAAWVPDKVDHAKVHRGCAQGECLGRPLARIDDDVHPRRRGCSVETGIQLAIPQHWLRQSARAQLANERGHPPLPADGVLKCRELVDQALLPAAEGPFADLDQKEQALNRSPQPQRSSSAATRRKRSISSPTFTYPCMAPMARSRSVLPERPVPAMNTPLALWCRTAVRLGRRQDQSAAPRVFPPV